MGDELPITFEAQGDLIETRQASISYVTVKMNFWIQLSQNNIQISLDGITFKNLNDTLTGSLEAGTGTDQNDGHAKSLNIMFKAFLK